MPIAAENPLGLRIPEQSPPNADTMTRPKEVEAWIHALPMASGTATAKKLFKALQSINRALMPTQDRLQIAQLFTSPINYAITTLERKYTSVNLPLSDKARLTALVCMRLNEELAYSYKSVVRDVAMGKIGNLEKKLIVISLFRAVQHLSQMVYQAAQIYEPFPKHIWRELHNLFAFAEANRWADLRLKRDIDGETSVSTLKSIYVQILLFAAASPYRLRQREIRLLYHMLPDWSDLLNFTNNTQPSDPNRCFVVQLKQDLPPTHVSLVNQPLQKPYAVIQTRKLVLKLQQILDELADKDKDQQSGNMHTGLTSSMAERLIQSLGQAPYRQFVRTHLNFDLDIVVGLNNIYRLISGDNSAANNAADFGGTANAEASELNPESVFASDFLDSESNLTLIPMDAPERIYLRGYESYGISSSSQTTSQPPPREPIWGSTTIPRPSPTSTSTLQTLNESPGGYCVHWVGDNIPGINIGELIGIQAPNNPNSYGLAVVRWMRHEPKSGLNLGLQLIAPNTFAVTATSSERRKRTLIQCLLVAELKSANRPASLVAPAMSFQVGMDVQIRHQDTEQRIKLSHIIDSTGAFSQFQFEYI